MRVTITPKDDPYRIECVVEFSEEEKAIIQKHGLSGNKISLPDGVEAAIFQAKGLLGSKPDPRAHLNIGQLVTNPSFVIPGPNPSALQAYKSDLFEKFGNMKGFIMANAEVGEAEVREF